MILSLLFCNSWRSWLGQKLTSPLLEKLTLYIADEERQRGREKDRGTFVMTDKKKIFSLNSFYIHFKTLKKHYTVINIMPPIMYYFKVFFFIHVYFFSCCIFSERFIRKLKIVFLKTTTKQILYSFITSRLNGRQRET